MIARLTIQERTKLMELGTSGAGKPSDPLSYAVADQEEELLGLAQLIGELVAENVGLICRVQELTAELTSEREALGARIAVLGGELENLKERHAPEPTPVPATSYAGSCENCKRWIAEGELVLRYADDVITHAVCPPKDGAK